MRLYLDAGNTRIKWQLRSGEAILVRGAGEVESPLLFAEIGPDIWKSLEGIAISTVRSDAARQSLTELIHTHCPAPVVYHWTRPTFGAVRCAYQDPRSMGADRWHALVAAWGRAKGACVVVDAGSAITVDYLEASGRHLGGYILPGRRMMLGGLQTNTARVLFDPENDSHETSPGLSTGQCVFHGINWLMQTIGRELARAGGGHEVILFTGGDAPYIKEGIEEAGLVTGQLIHCPDLVLDGLALVDSRL